MYPLIPQSQRPLNSYDRRVLNVGNLLDASTYGIFFS